MTEAQGCQYRLAQMRRLQWVESLKEQHPSHQEAAGFYGADFGDHILGRLQEEGASV